MHQKENEFAIQDSGKENLASRLRKLIGTRSARSAAAEWGLSFSTLNNYLNRGTDPSFSVMQTIATKEGVSLDWLAFGMKESNRVHPVNDTAQQAPSDGLEIAWLLVYKALDKDDLEALMGLLLKEGARGVLALSCGKERINQTVRHELTELERALLRLPAEEQERLMALHEAKKGAFEGSEVELSQSLASEKKQAG